MTPVEGPVQAILFSPGNRTLAVHLDNSDDDPTRRLTLLPDDPGAELTLDRSGVNVPTVLAAAWDGPLRAVLERSAHRYGAVLKAAFFTVPDQEG